MWKNTRKKSSSVPFWSLTDTQGGWRKEKSLRRLTPAYGVVLLPFIEK
jgi:hypothetical protein